MNASEVLTGPGLPFVIAASAASTAGAAFLARIARRRWIRRLCTVAVIVGAPLSVVGAWAHFVEPRWIASPSVPIAWRGPPLRIALLGDLHAIPGDGERVRGIVARTNAHHAELVLIAGDFVEGLDASPAKLDALAGLSELRAPLGVFAVLGNHDSESSAGDPGRRIGIVQRLVSLGVRLVDNEAVELPNGVLLVGLGSWRADDSDPKRAFAMAPGERPTVVLAHEFRSLHMPGMGRFDVALTGHTHAGQVCLPFTERCPFLEADMQPYRYGLHDWPTGGKLYVTSGLGTSGLRARLGARPEIAFVELHR